MSIKDHKDHYSSLNSTTPNTVSRSNAVGERSFEHVVFQAGKPVLDSELNESSEIRQFLRTLLQDQNTPSGFLTNSSNFDGYTDFLFGLPSDPDFPINSFRMNKRTAIIAGMPVVIEYASTTDVGKNNIQLTTPKIFDGTSSTFKRTDFVFLEVWRTLVASSPIATGTVQVSTPVDGDTVTIDGQVFTAKNTPAVATDFTISGTDASTAQNLASVVTSQSITVKATFDGTATVLISALTPGAAGNTTPLVTSDPANFILSGGTLLNGADRINKPAQNKIYRHGNTQSPSGVWLDDEIADTVVISESAQRIQIQYRIRTTGTTENVNHKTQPDGFSNTSILAQGALGSPVAGYPFVRADGSSTSSSSSAVQYEKKDTGLWIAGDGSSAAATSLGTLDGFVYAIPIGFVFRRNNCSDVAASVKGFDPENNTNGGPTWNHGGYTGVLGAIASTKSDRPDGAFCDVIQSTDFLDLRRHVSLSQWDMSSCLQHQMQSLLDGQYKTWAIDTASKQTLGNGSGDVSTQPLICDEIGRLNAQGGSAPDSGTTTRGENIRNFDHISRRFSSHPNVERLTVAFYPGDRPTAGAQGGPAGSGTENAGKFVVKAEDGGLPITTTTWYENDSLVIDLNNLDATTLGSIFDGGSWTSSGAGLPNTDIQSFFPSGTVITDILQIRHDDGNYTSAINQIAIPKLILGMGTPKVEVHLDANDRMATGGLSAAAYKLVGSNIVVVETASPRRIFVEFEVSYPAGAGTTNTPEFLTSPDTTVSAWSAGSVLINNVTQNPTDMETLIAPNIREGFREVQLEYLASDDGASTPISDDVVSLNTTEVYFPRRVFGDASFAVTVADAVTAAPNTIDVANTEYGSSSCLVKCSNPLSGPQTLCEVSYFAQDPIPNYGASGGGFQVSIYYRANAPQTAGVKEGAFITGSGGVLPKILIVKPLLMSEKLWTGLRGVGSDTQAYPYSNPLEQIPTNDNGSLNKDWFLAATTNTSIQDFDSNTGMLSLHSMIPAHADTLFTFGGNAVGQDPQKDAEFRVFYPFADIASYRPSLMAQPLSGSSRHKVFSPFMAQITEDVPEAVGGGILFRRNELVLVVLSRFAELDKDNVIRFTDSNNTTSASVYRTKNLLILSE